MDRRNKIGVRQWFALVVRDGNQWHFAEATIEGLEIPQILPAVQRGQGPSRQRAEQGEMKQIDVKMENVEFVGALANLIDHQHEMRNSVEHRGIKPKRATATGNQVGAGNGVAACKKRHIVAQPDKLFGQVGHDPLGAAIQTRGNALDERSDLCDFHNDLCSRPNTNACNAAKFLHAETIPTTTRLRRSKKSSGLMKEELRLLGAGGARRQAEPVQISARRRIKTRLFFPSGGTESVQF